MTMLESSSMKCDPCSTKTMDMMRFERPDLSIAVDDVNYCSVTTTPSIIAVSMGMLNLVQSLLEGDCKRPSIAFFSVQQLWGSCYSGCFPNQLLLSWHRAFIPTRNSRNLSWKLSVPTCRRNNRGATTSAS